MMAEETKEPGVRKPVFRAKCCSECGEEFSPGAQHGDFCKAACRKAFNNRRMIRGAELYDLFMTLRHDRSIAVALGIWKILCRMSAEFRREDVEQRQGRKSWRPARQVLDRHSYLAADVLSRNIAGVRRDR